MKKDSTSFPVMLVESIILRYRYDHPDSELSGDQLTYDELSDMIEHIRDIATIQYPHMSEKIHVYMNMPVVKESVAKWILYEIEKSGVDIDPSVKNVAFLMNVFEFGLHNGAVPILGFNMYLNMSDDDIDDMVNEINNTMDSSYRCKKCREGNGKVIPLFPEKEEEK